MNRRYVSQAFQVGLFVSESLFFSSFSFRARCLLTSLIKLSAVSNVKRILCARPKSDEYLPLKNAFRRYSIG